MRDYLLSLPERLIRSSTGLAAGLLRELSTVTIPASLRRTRLYQNLVENTLRFVIQQVAEVEGAYPAGEKLADDFAIRRAAGNGIEFAGIVAFRASPVWVLAALADVSGTGRNLINEIAAELRKQGLLEPGGGEVGTMEQLLAGLERFSARTVETINTPPLDLAVLRQEWKAIQQEAASVPAPAIDSLERFWREMKQEAAAQDRSVFILSSAMALSAIASVPGGVRWLSRSTPVAARRTGELLGEAVLGHYRQTLDEIRRTGFLAYWIKVYRPYLKAAAQQLSPKKSTWTERWLNRGSKSA